MTTESKKIPVMEHLSLLGHKIRDRVTGQEGVVESIAFDLYGCIQATVNPGIKEDGERKPSYWYDVSRLDVLNKKKRVMSLPAFAEEDADSAWVYGYLHLLGYQVRDRVTQAAGILDSVSFELYGHVHGSMNPGLKEDGEKKAAYWYDMCRLQVSFENRVMPLPNFVEGPVAEGTHGPADKPMARA